MALNSTEDMPEGQVLDYQTLFECLPGLYLILSPNLKIITASNAYLKATKTERKSIAGRHIFDVFPDNPDDQNADGTSNLGMSLQAVLRNRAPDTMAIQKYDIRKPDSEGGGFEERYWSPVNCPLLNKDGEVLCIIHRVEDVTQYIKASMPVAGFDPELLQRAQEMGESKRKLQANEERYELALKGSKDVLWDWDVVNQKVYWSDQYKVLLEAQDDTNFNPDQIDSVSRIHPDDNDRVFASLDQHIKHRIPYDVEYRLRTNNDRYIWVHARGMGVWNDQGDMIRMSGSLTEITGRKAIEESLRHARAQADRASQAKSEFLANMSHELRTPLNSILGLTRMLYEDQSIAEEQREAVGIAFRSARSLLDIVNDILDLSKVEAGKLELEHITFSLEEVMDNVMEIMLPLSSEKGLILSCNMPKESRPYFIGDPVRLERILINLVGNAIKYTHQGSVTINIEFNPMDDSKKIEMRCEIIDTGIGIALNKQKLIFEKFEQADSSITREYGGTGLGLNITKQLIHKMGGEIGVESTLGKGSRFWFHIVFDTAQMRPLVDKRAFRRQQTTRLPADLRKPVESVELLVAEDHALNQAFMHKLLSSMGIKDFDMVENGQAALDAMKQKAYDMILMDCHMPVMSGYDSAKQIRVEEKKTGSHIPIIAMTADAMPGTRERCLKAGMDEYLSKPINQDELRVIMGRWITFADKSEDSSVKTKKKAKLPQPVDFSMLEKFSDNAKEMRSYLNIFVKQADEILEALSQNCTDGDNKAWVEAAHKLKGSSAIIQAENLRQLCEQAQSMKYATAQERSIIFTNIEAAYHDVRKYILKNKKTAPR